MRAAAVGICAVVVVLSSSAAFRVSVASSAGASGPSGARSTVDVPPILLGSSLSSPQPSPYCFPFICCTPQDLRAAYNYPAHLNGAGQTIVIIDAFGGPAGSVQSERNAFDSAFNLPAYACPLAPIVPGADQGP